LLLFWALASCLLVVYEAAKGNRKMCENCTEKGQVNGAKKKMEKGRNIFLLIHSRSVLDLPPLALPNVSILVFLCGQ